MANQQVAAILLAAAVAKRDVLIAGHRTTEDHVTDLRDELRVVEQRRTTLQSELEENETELQILTKAKEVAKRDVERLSRRGEDGEPARRKSGRAKKKNKAARGGLPRRIYAQNSIQNAPRSSANNRYLPKTAELLEYLHRASLTGWDAAVTSSDPEKRRVVLHAAMRRAHGAQMQLSYELQRQGVPAEMRGQWLIDESRFGRIVSAIQELLMGR